MRQHSKARTADRPVTVAEVVDGRGAAVGLAVGGCAFVTPAGLSAGEQPEDCIAFVRADRDGLWIAAAPGELIIDGRVALCGIGSVSCRDSHVVRVGSVSLSIGPPESFRILGQSESAICMLSGEQAASGDVVFVCTGCSMTALASFMGERGDCCPRCGRKAAWGGAS